LAHVVRDHDFQDKALFYRFTADEDHGTVGEANGRVLCESIGAERIRRRWGAPAWADLSAPLRRSRFRSKV
jgi:hypothetical protein